MSLTHKYTPDIARQRHKPQKTFMDYIKLSSVEIPDDIAARTKKDTEMWYDVRAIPKCYS